MKHLTEDELIERYYGEGTAEAARHLETCGECAGVYAALRADLNEIAVIDAPPRDEGYGEEVWRAVSPLLMAYPKPRPARRISNLWLGLSAAAACAVLVMAAFYAGRVWEQRQPHATVAAKPAPPQKHVVIVVLSDHLDRTERLLVELKHADTEDAEILPPLRDEARTLLTANQRFKKDAEESGDPALTTALDRLDHLLTKLANQPGGWNARTIDELRREMDTDGLLFEVRVLRSRISDGHTKQGHQLKGGAA